MAIRTVLIAFKCCNLYYRSQCEKTEKGNGLLSLEIDRRWLEPHDGRYAVCNTNIDFRMATVFVNSLARHTFEAATGKSGPCLLK
jgi:hypothetical protein